MCLEKTPFHFSSGVDIFPAKISTASGLLNISVRNRNSSLRHVALGTSVPFSKFPTHSPREPKIIDTSSLTLRGRQHRKNGVYKSNCKKRFLYSNSPCFVTFLFFFWKKKFIFETKNILSFLTKKIDKI